MCVCERERERERERVCVNVFNMHNYIKERLLLPHAQLEAKVKGQTISLHYMFLSMNLNATTKELTSVLQSGTCI